MPNVPLRAVTEAAEQASTATSTTSPSEDRPILSFEEVQAVARSRDLNLIAEWLGPAFKISVYEGADRTDGKLLGVAEGFVAPWVFGILHIDSLRIFNRGMTRAERENARGGIHGLCLLIGYAILAAGNDAGCSKAELLAINDSDEWAARLVRFYKYFGFETVAEVTGERLSDTGHQLIWGGIGTRMDGDIKQILSRFGRVLLSRQRT